MKSVVKSSEYLIILIIFLVMVEISQPKADHAKNVITIESIRCVDHDLTFSRYTHCELKPINRTLKYLSVEAILLQPLIRLGHVELQLWKKANGYKPFIFNVSIDFCLFLAGRKSVVADWMYSFLQQYSNMNHSCPYKGALTLVNMPLMNPQFPSPLPGGSYRLDVRFIAYRVLRATFMIFTTVKEI